MTESFPAESREDPPGAGEPATASRAWGRVQALFEEALSLEPDAQGAFLRRAAAQDAALVDQVRSLLASHQQAGDFLEIPAASAFGLLAVGERIGPYRIEGEIGRGGMGVVYRATRDDAHFTKDVAIKLVEPGVRSAGVLRRFRSERQILAMLEHPNIARLLDGGETPNGTPYLVMEYVEGMPLLDYCDQRRLGIDERLRLFLVVCDAVAFAHRRLIVHRDLKPENILVTADGSPKLLDFGIAKLLSQDPGEAPTTITAPAQRMLTPDYASPEQVLGNPVTVTSDVYSLGVVLHELLTGTRPLHFKTRTFEEVLRVVAQEEPAPPSTVVSRAHSEEMASRRHTSVTRWRRRLAGDLDYIVLKALEKDPARRYPSVDLLEDDLRRHLEHLPVRARGQTTRYLLSRLVRRHRVAVVTGSIVLASLVAGLAGTAWQARVASLERDRAQRRFDDVRALAHAVVFDIHDAIANLPGATKARETIVLHALRYLDRLSQEAVNDPSLLHEMGVAYGKIGDVQGRPEFSNLGRTADALRSYQRSLEILGQAAARAPDSVDFVRDCTLTMQRLGDLWGQMGRKGEALRLNREAKRRIVAERIRHPESILLQGDLGVACDRIADLRLATGDTLGALQESLEGMRLVTDLCRRDPGEPNWRRSLAVGHAKTAYLRAANGDRAGAASEYQQAQELSLDCLRNQPSNADLSRDIGVVYGMRALFLAEGGEIDSALALYEHATEIAERLAALDPSDMLQQADIAKGRFEVGTVFLRGHRYPEAGERFADAYRRYSELARQDSTNTQLRAQMARACQNAGDACGAMAARSHSPGERSRWRSRAAEWYSKSMTIYRSLAASGSIEAAELEQASKLLKSDR